MLEVSALSVRFGQRRVIQDLSLMVTKGEVLALIGPNGAGKTTLLRAASGVIPIETGSVRVNGHDIAKMTPRQLAACLSVVPQARNLPLAFTVWQAVLLGRTPYLNWMGQASPKDVERTQWSLERTDLWELRERLIGELSGGEQQRVLLARALAQDTPILLMDEPTTFLDLHHQATLLNLVRDLSHENGLAVLMAIHDLNLAALYSDRIALLVRGNLVNQGTPLEVLTSENISQAFGVSVHVIPHPDYGIPLVLPDGQS